MTAIGGPVPAGEKDGPGATGEERENAHPGGAGHFHESDRRKRPLELEKMRELVDRLNQTAYDY